MRQPPIIKAIFSQPDEAYNNRFEGMRALQDPDQETLSKRSEFGQSVTVCRRRRAECRFTTQLRAARAFRVQFAALRHWKTRSLVKLWSRAQHDRDRK